jgi:hypothetical protein
LKKIKDIEAQALQEQKEKEESNKKRRNRSRDRKKKVRGAAAPGLPWGRAKWGRWPAGSGGRVRGEAGRPGGREAGARRRWPAAARPFSTLNRSLRPAPPRPTFVASSRPAGLWGAHSRTLRTPASPELAPRHRGAPEAPLPRHSPDTAQERVPALLPHPSPAPGSIFSAWGWKGKRPQTWAFGSLLPRVTQHKPVMAGRENSFGSQASGTWMSSLAERPRQRRALLLGWRQGSLFEDWC